MDADPLIPGKHCTKCGEHKPLSAFYPAAKGPQGRQCQCKACYAEKYREKTAPARVLKEAEKANRIATAAKVCPRCMETKGRSLFGRDSRRPDGQRVYCKACNCAVNTASRAMNIETAKASEQRWRDANKEAISVRGKRWRKENPERAYEMAMAWRAANPERQKEIERRSSKRRSKLLNYRLRKSISEGIRLALRGRKSAKTFELLGMTFEQFKVHLARQFLPGMTWDNYGKWHIDHIVPLSAFRIESAQDEAFKAAWSPANLRPLWAQDNLRKHAKLTHLL